MFGFCHRFNFKFSNCFKKRTPILQGESHSHILLSELVSDNCLLEVDIKLSEKYSDDDDICCQEGPTDHMNELSVDNKIIADDSLDEIVEESLMKYSLGKFDDRLNISIQSGYDNQEKRCQHEDCGCTTVLLENQRMFSHIQVETYQHSILLIAWIKNIEKIMLAITENRKEILPHKNLETIKKDFESIIMNPLIKDSFPNEDYRMVSRKLHKALSNVTNKFYDFANLIWELKAINDKHIKRFNEIVDKHEVETLQLNRYYQSQNEKLKQELSIAIENSKKNEEKIVKLKKKIEKLHPKLKDFKKTSKRSTITSVPVREEQEINVHLSSLEWIINELAHKIENHLEIWSKYFQSPNKRFTMRLWLHLNNISSSAQLNIELLIWNNLDNSNVEFQFTGLVTVSVKNQIRPFCNQTISKHCKIEDPHYSELFIFNYFDLQKSGVLDDDSIIVQCIVVND